MIESKILLSAGHIAQAKVKDHDGNDLGELKEIMIDLNRGDVEYVVLSLSKGYLGLKDKCFAIPWEALKLDSSEKSFTLDVTRGQLEDRPGIDKDNWPNEADSFFQKGIDNVWKVEG